MSSETDAIRVITMISAPVVLAGMLMGGGAMAYKFAAVSDADNATLAKCERYVDPSVNNTESLGAAAVSLTNDGALSVVFCSAAEIQTAKDVQALKDKMNNLGIAGLIIIGAGGLIQSNTGYIYMINNSNRRNRQSQPDASKPKTTPKP